MSLLRQLFDRLKKPAPLAIGTLQAPHEKGATLNPVQPQENTESANLALLEAGVACLDRHGQLALFRTANTVRGVEGLEAGGGDQPALPVSGCFASGRGGRHSSVRH